MNCSEFEKKIYLYRELSASERKTTDEHLVRCESCSVMASRILQHREMIKNTRSVMPAIKDPEWLTQRIMNEVERKEKPVNLLNRTTSLLDNLFVRYAFSALSVLLITFFFIQQQKVSLAQPVAKVEIKQGPILNTSTFLKTHLMSRQKREPSRSISRYSYHKSERVAKTL